MAPSATVPKTIAPHIHSVTREGRDRRRRSRFGPDVSGAAAGSSSRRPVRAQTPSTARRATATPKCAATDPVAAVMPEASSAASSDPALKVACSRAMVLRSKRVSRAAPCAFMATFRQPTRTPSAHITSRASG